MRRFMTLILAMTMLLTLTACGGNGNANSAADTAAVTGVEDGVLTVGMECAYAPYNWTQTDNSNGAVAISNVPGAYANG